MGQPPEIQRGEMLLLGCLRKVLEALRRCMIFALTPPVAMLGLAYMQDVVGERDIQLTTSDT